MIEIRITNSPAKIKLLKEWMNRKGTEPWTGEEIAELIADATWLAEERTIKLLGQHNKSKWCGVSDCPSPFPSTHLAELIKGEQK